MWTIASCDCSHACGKTMSIDHHVAAITASEPVYAPAFGMERRSRTTMNRQVRSAESGEYHNRIHTAVSNNRGNGSLRCRLSTHISVRNFVEVKAKAGSIHTKVTSMEETGRAASHCSDEFVEGFAADAATTVYKMHDTLQHGCNKRVRAGF